MNSLRKLAYLMKPFWLSALLAPLLMTLEVAMDLSQPRFLQNIVDIGIAQHNLPYVLHTCYKMLLFAVFGVIGGIGCTIFSTYAGLNFGTAVRDKLFDKIQQLSFGNLDKLQTGGLITRVTNDVDQVQEAALMLLRILVRAPLLTIGSLTMAIITAPKLSIILLIIGPLLIIVLYLVNRRAHPLFSIMQDRLDKVNTVIQENLAGIRVVKAFVRSDHETARFNTANEDFRNDTTLAFSIIAIIMPGMMLLVNFGIVGVLWYGGISVTMHTLHIGQLLAFINYLLQMLSSLMMVGMLFMRISRADASAERILEVLHSSPEVQDSNDAIKAPLLKTGVVFNNVSFCYDGKDGVPVLSDISFTAKLGETIAIIGATGSGKSTLAHLIPRLYDATSGQILFDDNDVRNYTQQSLHKQISIVMQNTILFSGTIRDNLRYGKSDATDEEIETATKMANASDFISSFPDGYDTILGQNGVNLSGGQKQRLSIARAIVAKPSILILDDCTSAVDMVTEREILTALQNWDHHCIRFIIAQRIGAIINANKIIVLDDGKIIAADCHNVLLKTCSIYQDIVQSQFDAREVDRVSKA